MWGNDEWGDGTVGGAVSVRLEDASGDKGAMSIGDGAASDGDGVASDCDGATTVTQVSPW